jgi:flagellar hook assembly protein FlgD
VRVLPASGQVFPFWTQRGNLSAASLDDSYSNFPNPFAAGREATTFVFALSVPSTVDLRLYTPRGEPVRTVLSGESRGVGLHQDVTWDGRNGNGDPVRNGVYVAEITVRAEDGVTTTLRRKVAVVR